MTNTFIAQNNSKSNISCPIVFNADNPYNIADVNTVYIRNYTVPRTNWYIVQATGSCGCSGSVVWPMEEYAGGKGVSVTTRVFLKKGEQLRILVGRCGKSSNRNAGEVSEDGVAGASGGSSSVWRVVPSITDSRYQFKKAGSYYYGEIWECLIFSAAGSGSRDGIYGTGYKGGVDAGLDVYTPSNFKSCNTGNFNPSSAVNGAVMGPMQIINWDGRGTYYSRNGDTCWGGYGGGGSADDSAVSGNAWYTSGTTPDFVCASFCYGEVLDVRLQDDPRNGCVFLYEVTE